jgi:hypothetical protein
MENVIKGDSLSIKYTILQYSPPDVTREGGVVARVSGIAVHVYRKQ